jgi:hypothetical protein
MVRNQVFVVSASLKMSRCMFGPWSILADTRLVWRCLLTGGAVTIAVIGNPTGAPAQDAGVASDLIPLHSIVDVGALSQERPREGAATVPHQVKPFRPRNAEELRFWKNEVQQNPAAVPPTHGFMKDRQ